MTRLSQRQKILNYLLTGRTITRIQAFKLYGCFNLWARIMEIEEDGYFVFHNAGYLTKSGKRVTQYRICRNYCGKKL